MEIYADISRQMTVSKGDQQTPGYYRALTDPKYRLATIICIVLAFSNQITGINAVNIYSTTIY